MRAKVQSVVDYKLILGFDRIFHKRVVEYLITFDVVTVEQVLSVEHRGLAREQNVRIERADVLSFTSQSWVGCVVPNLFLL
jgi:hypothetical protein